MTDETPDYMTDEEPEYTADELGDHDDLLAEGRLGHVEHIGARWRTGFVRYEPDGHSMTVRLVAEGTPQGDPAIIDLVVAEAVAVVQQVASINHVYLSLRSSRTIRLHASVASGRLTSTHCGCWSTSSIPVNGR